MGINLNTAPEQKVMGGVIPSGTICSVLINVRGRKDTKAKDGEMLDLEFTVLEGEYEKWRIWEMMMIKGNGSEGHNQALDITMSRVRAIIESAKGIDPSDDSKEAMAARDIDDWEDIDGLNVLIRVGIEKGVDPYPDKNKVLTFITPDMDDYDGFEPEQPAKRTAAKGKAAPAAAKGKAKAEAGTKKPKWG